MSAGIDAMAKDNGEDQRILEDIVAFLGEGVYVLDGNGLLTFMNPEAEYLLGWKEADLLGRKLHEIIHSGKDTGDTMPIEECLAYNVLKTGKRQYSENDVFKRKDGTTFPVALVCTPVIKEGNIVASITSFRDITGKKKIEDELLNIKKLEAIGVLAGGIAHDFNNLLTAILGNISFAKMLLNPEDKIFGRLSAAENAAVQARDLTYQLLTFARGGEPLRKAVFIPKLIRSSAGLAASGSNIICELSIPDDLWPSEIDEGQISQVLYQLIINAREAMPAGGIVKVYAENVSVGIKDNLPLEEGKYIKMAIEDNGTGIPAEQLSSIFDPYFTTKEMGSQKGAGFGLAICYAVIKKHDGLITVESEVGRGTTFRVYLPAAEREVMEKRVQREIPAVGRGKILVMDDEEVVRMIIGNMLEHIGYKVGYADRGEEAIELYKREKEAGRPFDAVILDLTIRGGMGGEETIQRLIEIDPEIRAIVSSGYYQDEIMTDFGKYGFSGALPKPYKMQELREILYAVITKPA